jgi:ribonuclease BN (tRNA processing enzyme)
VYSQFVNHGEIEPAYGYRITTEDKTIVISGDTAYSEKVLQMSRGADLLFHEVISDSGLATTTEFWQEYHRSSHTVASDLGRLASEAQPGLVVMYHALFYGVPESNVVDEVESTYSGKVVLADDLDIF